MDSTVEAEQEHRFVIYCLGYKCIMPSHFAKFPHVVSQKAETLKFPDRLCFK